MIRDLQLMKDPKLLHKKKCVIWGAGKNGKQLYRDLLELGMRMDQIFFCDSNAERWNADSNYKVFSIEQTVNKIADYKSEYQILISVESLTVQGEIIDLIKKVGLFDLEIYTYYGIKWAKMLEKRKKGITVSKYDAGLPNYESEDTTGLKNIINMLSWFVTALYSDTEQRIIVYTLSKSGSTTLRRSLESYGVFTLWIERLNYAEYLNTILSKKKWKIISVVRNPLERHMARFFQNLEHGFLDNPDADFFSLHENHWDFLNYEFKWYENEIKSVIGIDCFAYPFDKERGYTVIQKDNIELLLLTTEKMDSLTDVIGDFVGINDFELKKLNIGNQKYYRFAYEEYKREVAIPHAVFKKICESQNMKHFYSEQDIAHFWEKWQNNIVYDGDADRIRLK